MTNRKNISHRLLALILTCALLLTGCMGNNSSDSTADTSSSSSGTTTAQTTTSNTIEFETEKPSFDQLSDPDLARYMSDSVYNEVLNNIDSDKYFVENVESTYVSKEYIETLEFNSQKNVFFGYTLEELDKQFQGKRYVFTLGDDGKTTVKEFEEYHNEYLSAIKDVAIGAGVILFCVTVSAVSAGAGAPAISMIFAAGAKTGASMAISGGAIGAAANGIITGIKTGDMESAMKAAVSGGAQGFKIGAISGALMGGAREAVALHGATMNGLTMNEAAIIQKESKYPLDVIKEFRSMDQYNICKEANLTTKMVNNKTALVRNIDLNYVDDATGLTNMELMQQGKAAIDPVSKLPYELHHIGQKADSTLAILTKAEHMQNGNNKIWHVIEETKVHGPGNTWNTQRQIFWKAMAKSFS